MKKTETKKQNNKLLLVVGVIVLVAVVIVNSFKDVRNKNIGKQQSNGRVQTVNKIPTVTSYISPTPFPTSATDPSTGWKILRNEKDGFIIKYPTTWYSYLGNAINSYNPRYDPKNPSAFKQTISKNDVKILIYWSSKKRTSDQSVIEWLKEAKDEHVAVQSVSELSLNGKTIAYARIKSNYKQDGDKYFLNVYYIPHENKVLEISSTPADSVHEQTVKKIVSTLQFIDK